MKRENFNLTVAFTKPTIQKPPRHHTASRAFFRIKIERRRETYPERNVLVSFCLRPKRVETGLSGNRSLNGDEIVVDPHLLQPPLPLHRPPPPLKKNEHFQKKKNFFNF